MEETRRVHRHGEGAALSGLHLQLSLVNGVDQIVDRVDALLMKRRWKLHSIALHNFLVVLE